MVTNQDIQYSGNFEYLLYYYVFKNKSDDTLILVSNKFNTFNLVPVLPLKFGKLSYIYTVYSLYKYILIPVGSII